MEIFILVGLIVLNGLFAMSEIAIVTARKSRLTAMAHSGSSTAKAALKLAEDPTQFLSTVQIGITSIGILNGIFVGYNSLCACFNLGKVVTSWYKFVVLSVGKVKQRLDPVANSHP